MFNYEPLDYLHKCINEYLRVGDNVRDIFFENIFYLYPKDEKIEIFCIRFLPMTTIGITEQFSRAIYLSYDFQAYAYSFTHPSYDEDNA